MLKKLAVTIGNSTKTAFLPAGFYNILPPSKNLHCHTHTEFHIISGGTARFLIGSLCCEVEDSSVFAIPPGVLHTCICCEPGLSHIVFQIDDPIREYNCHTIDPILLQAFLSQIRQSCNKTDHTAAACYIALVCSDFYPKDHIHITVANDYAFAIYEFFSHHYQENVSLSDLAAHLHFSEKHTGRLVMKYTGRSFKDTLIAHRIAIAKHLAETTDFSMQKISEYVGYRSYSGFWKAYTKANLQK